jgi:hypothetical protein
MSYAVESVEVVTTGWNSTGRDSDRVSGCRLIKTITTKLIPFVVAVCGVVHAQTPRAANDGSLVTAARVAKDNQIFGPVYATIGGKEKKIADYGMEVWIIERGRRLIYSGREGAGGYENEGQSLHVYDPQTGRQRKILSEYYMVAKLTEVTTSAKKTALLVKLEDGGLGASYFAVVDPDRGELFFRRWARLSSRKGDIIALGFYKEADWEKLAEEENAKVPPYRKEQYNLNAILKGPVIINKRQ